jgi:hypothetical protein
MLVRSTFLGTVKACPCKAYYKHILGLQPIANGTRNTLPFGRLIHDAIELFHNETLDKAIKFIEKSDVPETKRKNKNVAKVLLQQYARKSDFFVMEEPEKEFSYQIGKHTWKGRFDGIGTCNGKRWVIEHKTTIPYYLLFKPNDQFIGYWVGAKRHYGDVAGVILNNLDCDKLVVNKFTIEFNDIEEEEWLEETEAVLDAFQGWYKYGVFPRNPGACLLYNTKCSYHPLCSEPESSRGLIMNKCFVKNENLINLEW